MQRKIVEQYLGGMLNPHDPRPKIIFIDEIGKCPKILKPVLRDLLLERVTPGFRLPEGSIVYAATNNPADGLGDVIAAHEGNAMTILPVLPPRLPYWLLKWAPANGISDLTCTVLQQNPQMWASYMVEDVTNNPLVFDPKRRAYSFCSPRSLTKNDRGFVQNRGFFTRDELYAGMAGTIGQAAADIFMVYIDMEKDTVDPHLIRSSPLTAPIPESAGTKIFTLFKLTPVIETQEDLANVMTYLERWNQREFEATFFQIVSNNPKTAPLVIRNPKMLEWRNDNHGLIGNIR
jgi:hypothetical protein